ncbi:MAG TPA: metal-dependent hydrolase [Candidatus Acidoferrum sp.]|nr:metal-dependent hydrolase [Candidatus Acidoferrum sp.]
MDTITHGIAGALIGKALCSGDSMFPVKPMSKARIITWALMLGAIFPDSDVLRDMLSKNELLMITWHRSYTHSLLLLPLFALALAGITQWAARKFGWDAPSYAALTGIYAIGILSHILLDLVTTFGTMIWTPLSQARPAWDLIFIVDFTLTGILLVPQLLAWAHRDEKRAKRRAVMMWMLFVPVTFGIAAIGRIVGAPISTAAIWAAIGIFSVLFLLPALLGWGARLRLATWNRAGLAAACVYVALTVVAHQRALERVKKFAEFQGVKPDGMAALPLPPSLWNWDGLIRAPRGVYELRMDLSQPSGIPATEAEAAEAAKVPLTYNYYPDAVENIWIQQARQLPEVQKVLWFDRFPVTRFHKEGGEAVVEIVEKRFPQVRPDRPAPFTYRVRFDAAGKVVEKGWVKE